MENIPERVLVVIPHPNDSEFWCAGSIAKWVREGAAVRYVVCTDGSRGTSDPEIGPEELVRVREREQEDAARASGGERIGGAGARRRRPGR